MNWLAIEEVAKVESEPDWRVTFGDNLLTGWNFVIT
jgi:hypothetical protein